MPKRFSFSVEPRTILGKQVKQLRREGLVPANVYGQGVDPTPISMPALGFMALLKQAGETGLIDLTIGQDAKTRPVLIHSMLLDPVKSHVLHVDFYQVNLKEKLTATVPLEFVGESPVVKNKEGILLELLQEIEVESLPTNIPSSIEVDISTLTAVDQGIVASDLPLPEGVTLQTEAEEMVCKIEPAQMAEDVEEAEADSTEAADGADAGQSEDTSGNE